MRDFIPVAQNTRYTQRYTKRDEHYDFFWKVVGQSSWKEVSGSAETTQGWYLFNAAGDLYEYVPFNLGSKSVDQVLALLRRTRERHEQQRAERLVLPERVPDAQPVPPPGSVVARVYSRILPLPARFPQTGAGGLNRGVGRDHLWILPGEVEGLVGGTFPEPLRARLVMFHLWDNVRGAPDRWSPEHVRVATFRAVPVRQGDQVRVQISGRVSISAPAGRRGYKERDLPPTGYDAVIEGELLYQAAARRVVRLKLLSDGKAWGEGTFTSDAPPGKFPLKIAFVLAEDPASRQVAPQGMDWGIDEYLKSRLPMAPRPR